MTENTTEILEIRSIYKNHDIAQSTRRMGLDA